MPLFPGCETYLLYCFVILLCVFRCCEKTVDVMRTSHESLLTIVEVLLYDPLYAWTISPQRAYALQHRRGIASTSVEDTTLPTELLDVTHGDRPTVKRGCGVVKCEVAIMSGVKNEMTLTGVVKCEVRLMGRAKCITEVMDFTIFAMCIIGKD